MLRPGCFEVGAILEAVGISLIEGRVLLRCLKTPYPSEVVLVEIDRSLKNQWTVEMRIVAGVFEVFRGPHFDAFLVRVVVGFWQARWAACWGQVVFVAMLGAVDWKWGNSLL